MDMISDLELPHKPFRDAFRKVGKSKIYGTNLKICIVIRTKIASMRYKPQSALGLI